ncbi:MAG: hypothetical protein NTZ09_06230 [Candidatus Hydrogenedentes bacterium]|nr:hypothetical protein [Candidatus Hydrogenedentota bacterium]
MSEVPPPVEEAGHADFAADSVDRPSTVGPHDLLVGVALIWGAELAFGTMAAGWDVDASAGAAPTVVLVLTLASNAATMLVAWWLVCRKYGKSFIAGFALEGVPTWSVIVWGVFGIVTAAGATVLIASYANDKGMRSPSWSLRPWELCGR